MKLYFAYGSNLLLSQIRERLKNPEISPQSITFLPDAKIVFPRESKNQKGGVASFEKKEDSKLWGAIFQLSQEEKTKLDASEGYKKGRAQNSYEEKTVEVVKLDGSKTKAITYVANPKGNFLPSQYYMDKIIRGAEDCCLPKYYLELLKRIPTSGVK